MAREFPSVTVTKKAEASLRAGHPWVYDTEISGSGIENGAVCDVKSEKGAYLGSGIWSEHSKIRVRIISTNANDTFDEKFWARRVKYAVDYRRNVMRSAEDFKCCRLIFGEADGMPGVTVDRYENILSAQILSYGMEQRKDMIYSALLDAVDGVDCIYERNESKLRELEGLEQHKGWYVSDRCAAGASPLTVITENGVRYNVDVENGQKTGFFLDQKYNRLAVASLARGKKVLDCFTHTGSFALNAAVSGAAHVTAVDVSESAIALARENAALNGVENMDFICTDVFELLPKLCESGADYNFVILDPPAFAKSRKDIANAARGYKEINYRAMKMLPRGGWLATCSCSHFMDGDNFEKMLISAAHDAGVGLKLIESRRQSPDHPVLLGVPETDYLKFFLFQIV